MTMTIDNDSMDYLSLPLEALGARDFMARVHQYFHEKECPSYPNTSSPPVPFGAGLPLPEAEPLNTQTGRRRVYFRRRESPIAVLGDSHARYIRLVFHGEEVITGGFGVCGTVLGYSDDDTEIIWHERGDLFASRVRVCHVASAQCIRAVRCHHCGFVFPWSEAVVWHLGTHLKGGGKVTGTFTHHMQWGTACGDTALMQELRRLRVIGEGAQGTVTLCEAGGNNNNNNNTNTTTNNNNTSHDKNDSNGSDNSFHSSHSNHSGTEMGNLCRRYALKCVEAMTEAAGMDFYRRAVRFMGLRHEHLVEYLFVRITPTHTTEILMPFYEEGDLGKVIQNFRGDRFAEEFICSLALQVASALLFLHERNPPIVHGDIKVENILVSDHHRRVVLSDFDTSKEMRLYESTVRVDAGTMAWMAPEALHHSQLMPASDVWSLGLVMYVLAVLPDFPMLHNPNTGEDDLLNAAVWEVYERNRSGELLEECVRAQIGQKGYSAAFAELVARVLSVDATKRPSAALVADELTAIMTSQLEYGDFVFA